MAANVAVTLRPARLSTLQVGVVPLQAPLQPVKLAALEALAVKVTVVGDEKLVEQAVAPAPHCTLPGVPLTCPGPLTVTTIVFLSRRIPSAVI